MEDCKPCHGTGIVYANGAPRQCPVCRGYGSQQLPYSDPMYETTTLSFKQALFVWVLAAVILVCVFLIGSWDGQLP